MTLMSAVVDTTHPERPTMSNDRRVTKDIIETLEDGKDGFARAAEKLADTDRSDLSTKMRKYSDQRGTFSAELEKMAENYGDDIDESGSVSAAVHRGWMTVKDALAGADPEGVLDAAEQGEDHAVSEYEDALKDDDISPDLRSVLERQFADIKQAHNEIKALRNAND